MGQSLILASASPRRRELLERMGLSFLVAAADAPEIKEGAPAELVMENARRKARAARESHKGFAVLGADTVVCQGGAVLGKPQSPADARRMLSLLSGNWHTVYTGVCVIDAQGREETAFDETRVQFTALSDRDVDWYVATGEPMDKAGAYAVQGIGGMYVRRIEGSPSNVIGLPMALVKEMLSRAGFFAEA